MYAGSSVRQLYAIARDSGAVATDGLGIAGRTAGPLAVHGGRAVTATVTGEVVAVSVPGGEGRWLASIDDDGQGAAVRAPVTVTDDRVYLLGVHGGVYAFDP